MIEDAIKTIRTLLPQTGSLTQEEIHTAVDLAMGIPQYSELDRTILIREVEALYNINIDNYRIIESRERRRPWLNDRKASIDWGFWRRYRDYLQIKKNFADTTISQIDSLTDRILDSVFDPEIEAIIDKRGLVVGQVQSGKTSNYTGLICKAADAGYKFIIVLAGRHNNLRSQTQLRLDEGFLGFDTQHERAFHNNNIWIGVGRGDKSKIAHSLTSSLDNGDFNAGAASALGLNFNTNEPIIAVVKKWHTILPRLKQWLSAQATDNGDGRRVIRNKSLLLIDDEADNASINTSRDVNRATTINRQIREILSLFDRSGYVGYTATPFANIFIPLEEDDLFPRDFIVNLPAPSNYIGPEKVFGFSPLEEDESSDTTLPIVQRINDYISFVPDNHKKDDALPTVLPESLRQAVKCFILSCAIRRLRGQKAVHNSMLVHVTRFTRWQGHIRDMVQELLDHYKNGIELQIPGVIEELRQTFEEDTPGYKSYTSTSQQILDSALSNLDTQISVHDWQSVLNNLNEACSRIKVKAINGGSADALNYFEHPNGLSVIAIGGDKLSRGLTLEGLCVSYYLRASRMYDTLMQMGRWFGYRPGYIDLCRLFTSRELNEWFCHITQASEELREEFDYMSDVAGSTPDKYATRVRTHPGVLQISASNKIRSAVEVQISWSGRLVESYEFQKRQEVIDSNLAAGVSFIKSLNGEPEILRSHYLWRNVAVDLVKSFLQRMTLSENLRAADPANLLRFIDAQIPSGELTNWSVAIMSRKDATARYQEIQKGETTIDIGYYKRNYDDKNSNEKLYYLRRSHIISPNHEFIDLTSGEKKRAMERTRHLWKEKGKEGEPKYPNGEIVRNEIRNPANPLLLIYFLNPEGARKDDDLYPINDNPIIGFAISFPGSKNTTPVSYAVHEELLPVFNVEDEIEDLYEED